MSRSCASIGTVVSRGRVHRRYLLPSVIGLLLGSTGVHALAASAAGGAPSADAGATGADALDASFDRTLLSGAGQNTTDLARFERGNFTPAGTYSVDIYLNDAAVGRSDVRFAAPSADASATPCVTRDLLDKLSLHPDRLSEKVTAELDNAQACVDIASVIPAASMTFEMSDLRLDTSVPQASLGQTARGYVDPKYWDAGVNAGLLNYNLNSYHTSSGGLSQTSSYLGLNAGLNLGLWHVRHTSSLNWQSGVAGRPATHHWQSIATYAQRDLPGMHAQLTVGDSWTSGELFDSVGLRGVQIATDDRMLPQSLRGYAPTVRGTADSNAKVTVRQNGQLIYQTTVAPGPFTIDDLYATGYGGDLEVSVTEANGRVHTFSVPYASVPQLLRPGLSRFSVAAGQLRDELIEHRPAVVQATVQHGFTNLLTGYAGVAGSSGYAALLAGSALNTRYGAFAMDITAAQTRIPGMDALSGQSVRVSYSKMLAQSGTSLTVAAYRYSTSGYLSLDDAAKARDYARRKLPVFSTGNPVIPQTINGVPISDLLTPAQQAALAGYDYQADVVPTGIARPRNTFSITLSQRLGLRGGSLYLNGSSRDYWDRSGSDTQFQLGYNNAFHRMNYSVSASRESDPFGRGDNRYMANVTIPLGGASHAPTLNSGFIHGSRGDVQQQATLSGTAGVDDRFNYGATATHDGSDNHGGTTGSINAGYRGTHAQLNAGFGAGGGYSQSSLGVTGGIVAHPGGVTFGQSLGDTIAIVQAPDAAGARIGNAAGVRVDDAGYALVPYVTPYILNTIDIDPTGLSLDVQLDSTSLKVAPRAGSVVMVRFKSESGRFVLIQVHRLDGSTLPFGAEVVDDAGQPVGVVGQAGRIMVRTADKAGHLNVHWQDEDVTRSCSFPYRLTARDAGKHTAGDIEQIDATCEPSTKARIARSEP